MHRNPSRSRRAVAAVFAFCLLLGACGSEGPETTQQADQSSTSASASAVPDAASVDTGADAADSADSPEPSDGVDESDAPATGQETEPEEPTGLDADTLGDRGLRLPGDVATSDDDAVATSTPDAAPQATATPEPEPVSVEPTPTVAPAPTPTPPPLNDPVVPQTQVPAEEVPSDELVVPGPPTDDGSEIEVISDSGILACVTTETAIEFLDRGDLTRTQEALQSAAALAANSSESGIAALASQLSDTGRDSDASFNAIVAMLSACAQYGYEV